MVGLRLFRRMHGIVGFDAVERLLIEQLNEFGEIKAMYLAVAAAWMRKDGDGSAGVRGGQPLRDGRFDLAVACVPDHLQRLPWRLRVAMRLQQEHVIAGASQFAALCQ